VPVDYHVTGHGTAQITYADSTDRLHTETASLPWSHSTRTHTAALSITLGKGGTTATCTVTVHGTPVQQATATGPYGRANCRAPLVTGTGTATGATP
jgi:MmpS family membrane protein